MTQEYDELAVKLESLGVDEVRVRLAHGAWSERHKRFVEIWLESKVREKDGLASAKRDEREERTLSIAAEALSIAKEANEIARSEAEAARRNASAAEAAAIEARQQARWAMYAAILAAAMAISANKDIILGLIL